MQLEQLTEARTYTSTTYLLSSSLPRGLPTSRSKVAIKVVCKKWLPRRAAEISEQLEAAWTATGQSRLLLLKNNKCLTEDMSRRTCICDMEGVLILKGNLVYLLSCYAVISGLVCDNNKTRFRKQHLRATLVQRNLVFLLLRFWILLNF
jgi:hypothetical protein